jgi:hypothetical protein
VQNETRIGRGTITKEEEGKTRGIKAEGERERKREN